MAKAFYSDLDLTLIYSHRAIRKYHNDTYDSLVVEEHESKPLSFMKLQAWELLAGGVSRGDYLFIPTTTRTFEQYSRISFPKVEVEYAITSNGGRIHRYGVEDLEWNNYMKGLIEDYELTPNELFASTVEDLYKIPGVNKVRSASGYFIYIVKDEAENHLLEEFLKPIGVKYNYRISHQGKKSYLVPKCLEKGAAVKYLNGELGVTKSVSAGDSRLDLSMAPVTDHFIQPKHGEAVGELEGALITENIGSDSAVEILEIVSEKLTN